MTDAPSPYLRGVGHRSCRGIDAGKVTRWWFNDYMDRVREIPTKDMAHESALGTPAKAWKA